MRSTPTACLVRWAGALVCFVTLLVAGSGCGGGSASPQTVTGPTGPILASIAIKPSNISIVTGSSLQFNATGKYSDGSTQDLTSSVSWASSTPGVASVSSSGLATALTSGQTTIDANMSGITGSTSLTVQPRGSSGSLGSATASSVGCPTSTINGTCYTVTISCPDINDLVGYVKVTVPSGTPVGTVAFSTGGNGTTLYEEFTYGATVLNTLLQSGFTLAQITWGGPFTTDQAKGWQTGPGGIRAVACRYATLAQWIYNNVHLANSSAPFCATGNSGGSEVIGQAMTHYGMGSVFTMVEPTSGPPFGRQDWACDCLQPTTTDPCGNPDRGFCVGLADAQNFVDPAYDPTIPNACSEEVEAPIGSPTKTVNDSTFYNVDSVTSPDAVLNYPNTFVNFLYGTLDGSTAPNQGHTWASAITSSKAETCVATAGHSMPDYTAGAQQIASDLLNYCKLPAK